MLSIVSYILIITVVTLVIAVAIWFVFGNTINVRLVESVATVCLMVSAILLFIVLLRFTWFVIFWK